VIPLAEFTLLQNDVLLIHEKQGDSVKDRLSIVLNSLLKGQAVQLALISKTGTNCTTVEFIPDPIETILGDAEFRLVTAHRKGTHFLLQGKGLKPNERISIQEQSGSLVHKHTILADEQGRLSAPIEPIVLGKLGGSASLILTREDHESRIDYAWGSKLEVESSQHSLFHPVIFSPKNPLQENGLSFIESEELAKKLHF
jgi:hypothetical protein